MTILEAIDVSISFGGLLALDKVSFCVPTGCIKAIIGPNGAGKTTLFNVITGLLSPQEGQIIFNNDRIDGLKPCRIATSGISRTFQNLSLFQGMTVLENVMLGRHSRTRYGFLSSVLRLPACWRGDRDAAEKAIQFLEFCNIADDAHLSAGALPFGKRRMVELSRAMATEPKLLLLDEPASGMNTKETDDLMETIYKIRDAGVTVLLVEHDMSLVMDVSDDILVLNFGVSVAEGNPASVRNNKEVVEIYLGGDFAGS